MLLVVTRMFNSSWTSWKTFHTTLEFHDYINFPYTTLECHDYIWLHQLSLFPWTYWLGIFWSQVWNSFGLTLGMFNLEERTALDGHWYCWCQWLHLWTWACVAFGWYFPRACKMQRVWPSFSGEGHDAGHLALPLSLKHVQPTHTHAHTHTHSHYTYTSYATICIVMSCTLLLFTIFLLVSHELLAIATSSIQ